MLRAVAVLAWRVSCAKRSRANMRASASGNVEGRRGKFTSVWGDQFFFVQTRNRNNGLSRVFMHVCICPSLGLLLLEQNVLFPPTEPTTLLTLGLLARLKRYLYTMTQRA